MIMDSDNRLTRRKATRLRPGKILSSDGIFLGDCAIVDRSAGGARLRLLDGDRPLPDDLWVYDETAMVRHGARLVWTAKGQAGLSFAGEAEPVEATEAERIAGRYYAVC